MPACAAAWTQSFLERPSPSAQIIDLERLARPGLHDLHRIGAIEVIGRPQRLMPRAQLVDRPRHRTDVELPTQLQAQPGML